jgi:hypothetical protein
VQKAKAFFETQKKSKGAKVNKSTLLGESLLQFPLSQPKK